jgi:E3 ubiquitin-protein ligase CCNP1IP1
MEQNLTCNVPECGAQLTGQAMVTVCRSVPSRINILLQTSCSLRSHAICLRCASNQGFAGQAPYSCPVCRQPLGASEICEQLLHPSEEWKSVALSGLSPTVVMECAGRALSFWSYQMTNQMSVPPSEGLTGLQLTGESSYQARKNSKLKAYCAELQGEVENIWGQANQRITTLTTKIRGQSMLHTKTS